MDAMKQYHIRWDSQSKDAGECMPLGGRDIGCNVWVAVFEGMIHVEIRSDVEHEVVCSYQNWRQEEFSCQYHDEIRMQGNGLLFYHQNQCSEVFDERIAVYRNYEGSLCRASL